MNNEKRIDYLRRLCTPYKKNDKVECFIMQYLLGSGNELKEKFWSPQSSSRLCFDLYSWMASDPDFKVIQFEKRIPGIKSGGRQIYPNMDVYFETSDGVFFIESKYTVTVINKGYKKDLPEAYWKTDNVYKSVSGKIVRYPIIERYHKFEGVKKEFISFMEEIDKKASKEDEKCWFDAKQETCHLLGIVLYALENKPSKPIHFLNVAANYSKSLFAEEFRTCGEKMVRRILAEYSINTSFDYQLCSVMSYLGRMLWLDKKGYAAEQSVQELLSDYSEPIR